ncbi:MAG: hypothetical protein LBO07_01130 [Coriobacteriales bacterium]|jgi:hypothetical protein|nr:hypothetical protein [Coriobacteriales bacterium]
MNGASGARAARGRAAAGRARARARLSGTSAGAAQRGGNGAQAHIDERGGVILLY